MTVISSLHRNNYLRSLNVTSASGIGPRVPSRHDQIALRAMSTSSEMQLHGAAIITIVILVISGMLAVLIVLYCVLWSKKIKRDEKKAVILVENNERTVSFFLARGKSERKIANRDDFQMRVEAVLQAEKDEDQGLHALKETEALSNRRAIPEEQLYDKETGFRFVFGSAIEQNPSMISVPPAVAICSESINSELLAEPIEKIPRIDSFKGLPPLQLPPPIIVLSGSRDSISRILVSPRQHKPEGGQQIEQKTPYNQRNDNSSEVMDLEKCDSDTLSPGQSLLFDIASFPIPPQNTAWLDSSSFTCDNTTSTTLSGSSTKYTETSRDYLLESFDVTRCSSSDDIKVESISNVNLDQGTFNPPTRDTILTAFENDLEDPLSYSTSTEDITAEHESLAFENESPPPRPVIESQPTFIRLSRVAPETNRNSSKPTHSKAKMSIDFLRIKARADKRLEMKKQEMKVFLEECQKLDVRPFLDERKRTMMMSVQL